jgi:flagellar biogenesis protein FliO
MKPPAPDLDSMGRMLGYITLLGALVGVVIYFLKFGLPIRKRTSDQRKLEVLEMRPLGNRQFLLVVGYEDTRMLLGVTPGKIDYLCPLDSPAATPSRDFASLLNDQEKPETKNS